MLAPLLLLTTSCRQDMQDQPKYKPLGANRFSRMGAMRGRFRLGLSLAMS